MSRPDMIYHIRDKTCTQQHLVPALFTNEQTIFQTNLISYLYVYDFNLNFTKYEYHTLSLNYYYHQRDP